MFEKFVIKLKSHIFKHYFLFNGDKMEVTDKILAAMKKAKKPLSAGQLAELTGTDRKEVDKAMKALKTAGKITSPKVCFWEPAK